MNMKRFVVNVADGVQGKLPVAGGGPFRILIDEEISGAQHFSLLVNEMAPGYKGKEHSHNVEHCWYVLQGTGIIRMNGDEYPHKTRRCSFCTNRNATLR